VATVVSPTGSDRGLKKSGWACWGSKNSRMVLQKPKETRGSPNWSGETSRSPICVVMGLNRPGWESNQMGRNCQGPNRSEDVSGGRAPREARRGGGSLTGGRNNRPSLNPGGLGEAKPRGASRPWSFGRLSGSLIRESPLHLQIACIFICQENDSGCTCVLPTSRSQTNTHTHSPGSQKISFRGARS
jgi:hypothetical protein